MHYIFENCYQDNTVHIVYIWHRYPRANLTKSMPPIIFMHISLKY